MLTLITLLATTLLDHDEAFFFNDYLFIKIILELFAQVTLMLNLGISLLSRTLPMSVFTIPQLAELPASAPY